MGAYCIRLDIRKVLVKVQPYTPKASVTQLAECLLYTQNVVGSSPSRYTIYRSENMVSRVDSKSSAEGSTPSWPAIPLSPDQNQSERSLRRFTGPVACHHQLCFRAGWRRAVDPASEPFKVVCSMVGQRTVNPLRLHIVGLIFTLPTIYASVAQVRGRVQPHPFPDHRAERVVGYLDTT